MSDQSRQYSFQLPSAVTFSTSPNKSTEYTSLDDLYTFDALKAVVEDMTAMKDELGIQGVLKLLCYQILTCVGREQPCQEINRCQLIFLRKLGVERISLICT